ncbi:hypothetical protein F5B20DRAFT_577973 [Whalleya microplaca]|nr:hypothetical protein F5B20DRAFT_577973 [Whalleya microplaca]
MILNVILTVILVVIFNVILTASRTTSHVISRTTSRITGRTPSLITGRTPSLITGRTRATPRAALRASALTAQYTFNPYAGAPSDAVVGGYAAGNSGAVNGTGDTENPGSGRGAGSPRGSGRGFDDNASPVLWTAAASLAFFSPDGARALIQQQQNQRPLVVGGRMASVRYNNRKGAPCHDEGSRVLIIKGDPQIVRYGFLKVFFATRDILYETDRRYYSIVNGESRIEWRFASYRGQARRAYDHLMRTFADRVSVEYGMDPCEAP